MSDVLFRDTKTGPNPLYLRESELIAGIELLFFAYRDFTSDPDEILKRYDFGRAHHRVIHFVGRNPGIAVAELLAILRITKQSLSRVLKQLVEQALSSNDKGRVIVGRGCYISLTKGTNYKMNCQRRRKLGWFAPIGMPGPNRCLVIERC